MSEAWRDDMRDSTDHFRDIVWPELRNWFGEEVSLHTTEGRRDELACDMDRIMGVDYWAVQGDAKMVSIASRVQPQYDLTTFTIRYSRSSGVDTEYQKRMVQLKSDAGLPIYTLQAYVDPVLGVLQNAAIVKTEDLYHYIDRAGDPGERWNLIQSNESEEFFAVSWGELDSHTDIHIHNRERAGLDECVQDRQLSLSRWCDD